MNPQFYLSLQPMEKTAIQKLHGNGMAVGMVPSDIFDEMIEDRETNF